MSVLTRVEAPARMTDKVIPSVTTPAPNARRGILPKDKPKVRYEEQGCERVWGIGLKKFEAEDLLDWLEANRQSGKVSYAVGKGFTVR